MDLSLVPYGATAASAAACGGGGRGSDKYRECMRNHAATIGGQAYDGCGEFMPGGRDGTIEALKCAACNCHRNFHRRDGGATADLLHLHLHRHHQPLLLAPPPPAFVPYGPIRAGSETPPRRDGEEREGMRRRPKRCRTRFTAEQKEKMQAFAERLGWRIQKHDDAAVQLFCVEIGVKRHAVKVWMHNNKNQLAAAAKPDDPDPAAGAAAAIQV